MVARTSRPPLSAAARRLVAARFVSHVGGAAGFFVGVWGTAAYELDATPSSLALLMAAVSIAQLVGSAIAGVLVDRADPRRVLLLGEAMFVPAILTLTTVGSMAEMTLRAPLAWFAGAFVLTAVTSFPPYLAESDREVERVNAAVEAAGTLAFILGPAVGSLTVRFADLSTVFVVDAATSVVGALLILPMAVHRVETEDRERGLGSLVAGFGHAYRSEPIALLLVLGTLTWLSFGMFSALEPLFYRDVLGTGPEALGYVNSVFGAGLLTGALLLDRSAGRVTGLRTVVVLTAAGGIGAIVYSGTASLVVVVIGAIVWGTILGVLMPLLRTLTHLHTREGFVGRVMGAFNVHHSVGELLPMAVAPGLAGLVGVQPVLVGTGVVLLALAPIAWPRAVRVDRERPVHPDPARHATERIADLEERVPPTVA